LDSVSRWEIFISHWIGTVNRKNGFSNPGGARLVDHIYESIGALLIGCGFLTRILAASAALGMAGALYTSVRLHEDWLRAALYLIVFVALALIGPGKFSVDYLIKSKTAAPAPPQ
jgi:uncharacterized membrane protein YphA (DoxX/SURF4 family)